MNAELESGLRGAWNRTAVWLSGLIGHDLLAVIARLSLAAIFLQSGRTKVDGVLHVTDSAVFLFSEEYKLPLVSPDRTNFDGFEIRLRATAENFDAVTYAARAPLK